jgi:hypothetical protein
MSFIFSQAEIFLDVQCVVFVLTLHPYFAVTVCSIYKMELVTRYVSNKLWLQWWENRWPISIQLAFVQCVTNHFSALLSSSKIGLTFEQRIFVAEHYFGSKSFLLCRKAFEGVFTNESVPYKTTVSRLIRKFRDTGSVLNQKRNRRCAVLNDVTLEDVRLSLLHFPSKLLRKLSEQKNMSCIKKSGCVLKWTPCSMSFIVKNRFYCLSDFVVYTVNWTFLYFWLAMLNALCVT